MKHPSYLSRAYVRSMLDFAEQYNCQAQISDILFTLLKLIEQEQIKKFLSDQMLPNIIKINLLLELLNKIQVDIPPFIPSLIELLITKNHYGLLPNIYNLYDEIYLANNNKIKITVTTAKSLENSERQQLELMLNKFFKQQIIYQYILDPNLLAGIVIKHQDKVIDFSIKNALLALRKEIGC